MRVTVKDVETEKLFNLMDLAHDLLQLARTTKELEVYVEDVKDGMHIVHDCPLSVVLAGVSRQIQESVEQNCSSKGRTV